MALGNDEVDVWFTNVDQRSSDRASSKISEMTDCVATRFEEATKDSPARFLIEPRGAIESLTTDVRDTAGAVVSAPGWTSAHGLLAPLNSQLVAIDGNSPRVYNDGETPCWVKYPDVVQTNVLTEDTVVGGYGTETTPDHAILDGVQAVVLTQVSNSTATLMIGFREYPGGQWIVPPYAVNSSALTDGSVVGHFVVAAGKFWLVYNDNSIDEFRVNAYDTHGVLLGTNHFGKLDTSKTPGYFDLTASVSTDATKVVIAQPAGDTSNPHDDVHVSTTSAKWNTMTLSIDLDTHSHADWHCNGPVAWARNKNLLDTHDYLLTRWIDAETIREFSVYKLDDVQAAIDNWSITGDGADLDALTGYLPAFDPSHSYLYLIAGYSEQENSTGPRFNPQERYLRTYRLNLADDSYSTIRTSVSHALATRPFVNGSTWQVNTFYQSGQGYAPPTAITPTLDGSTDYFYGSGLVKLPVVPGDFVEGSPIVGSSGGFVTVSDTKANHGIIGGDSVSAVVSSGMSPYIPDGTPVLKWTLANQSFGGFFVPGGYLVVAGTGIADANKTWVTLAGDGGNSHVVYTLPTSTVGTGIASPGAISAGTSQVNSNTAYGIPEIDTAVSSGSEPFFVSGKITVTGSSISGNNVTNSTVLAVSRTGGLPVTFTSAGISAAPVAWTATTTQSGAVFGFNYSLSPGLPNVWNLSTATLSTKMIGGSLVVTGDTVQDANNGSFEITDVLGTAVETAGATTLVSERFSSTSLPSISLELGSAQIAYTFHIASLATDLAVNAQRFFGATLSFVSSHSDANTGTYRIIGWDPAINGTIYTQRIVADDGQVPQGLVNGSDSVVIYLSDTIGAPFQPTYFMVPTEGIRAMAGCFDRLQAYNDWRINGVNTLHGHLSGISDGSFGNAFLLTTRQQPANIIEGTTVTPANTVGVKCWTLANGFGTPSQSLIPGPLACSFEQDAFPEDGFQLAPEAPWFVGQDVADAGQLALTAGTKYIYQFMFEAIDQEGNRVFSPLSPPLAVQLTGDNNQVTIGGCLPTPWFGTPVPIAGETAVTNRTQLALTVGRTSVRNGTTTVVRYRLTSNLNPNVAAPLSTDNPSGFTFDGERHITFEYTDQNADDIIQNNDSLPTGLPRFGAPPFSHGATWQGRNWLIGTDGALNFSTAETDGVRESYNPLFRIAPPLDDRPVRVVALERYLAVLCTKSVYWLPSVQMPNAAGIGGTIPALVKTKFTNGCVGPAVQTGAGAVYSSSAGGLWLVTEDLQNLHWSVDVRYFDGNPPVSMTVDGNQRLICALTDGKLAVYDFVSRLWSKWTPPAATSIVATHSGSLVTGTPFRINKQTTGTVDVNGLATSPIAQKARLDGITFGGVRHFARLRKMQLAGEYRGPHNILATLNYPDDYPDDGTTYSPKAAVANSPYLYSLSPLHGKSSLFTLELQVDFSGVDNPGASCAWEVISCVVGLDKGIKSVPANKRFGT